MKKYIAECVGTFVLTFLGCGTAMFVGCGTCLEGYRSQGVTRPQKQA